MLNNGKAAYDGMWHVLRLSYPATSFAFSGAFDVETWLENQYFREASQSLPWMQGWNQRADEIPAADFQMNLYNTGAVVNPPEWDTDEVCRPVCVRTGWTGYQFWRSMWGKGEDDFDENFPAPQNYRDRPGDGTWAEAFAHLQVEAVNNVEDPPNPSAVLWICDYPESTDFTNSRDAFLDFRDDHRVVHTSDRPQYKINAPDRADYHC